MPNTQAYQLATEIRERYETLKTEVAELRKLLESSGEPGHYRVLSEQTWLRSLERALDNEHHYPEKLTETLVDWVERAEFRVQLVEVREP